jgi:arylsulfatase A-like enzyme
MVYAVDRGVGKLVDALKTTRTFDNTLIVFLSDNGGKISVGANNHPLREGKGSTHEGGFRVPMLFHLPGKVPAGKQFEHPVSALDFYPTFAGLAQARIPKDKKLDGIDIWEALLKGNDPRKGEMIYALRHRLGYNDVAARKGPWKIARTYEKWKLYNIAEDVGEHRDLSAQFPERLQQMVAETEKWSRDHQAPQWYDEPKVGESWRTTGMPNYEKTFEVN